MLTWFSSLMLLAQEGAQDAAPENADPMGGFLIYMIGGLAIFMVVQLLFGRGDSRERARRDQMIGSLKKNDPVVTIGGILGHVVSVSEDRREVTIRVDDNTRLKMQASAIREVLVKENKEKDKAAE